MADILKDLSTSVSHYGFIISLIFFLSGIVILFFGRKLFWFFVSIIIFILGFVIANLFISGGSILIIFVPIALGGIAGLLSKKITVILSSIIAFPLAGIALASIVDYLLEYSQGSGIAVILFIVGGIVGSVLCYKYFDIGLILQSSFFGAFLIVLGGFKLLDLHIEFGTRAIVMSIIALLGITFQYNQLKKEQEIL